MYLGRSSAQIERDFGRRLTRLMREGFDVHVLAGDDGGFGALAERGVQCKPLPIARKLNAAGLVGAYFIVQAYFLEKRPVLVHAFDDVLPWLGALAARRADTEAIFATVERHAFGDEPLFVGAPEFVDRLVDLVEGAGGQPVRRGMLAAYARLGEWVDKYCVTNEHDFQVLQDLELMPPQKLEMIIGASGVDLEAFDIDDEDFPGVERARQLLDVPDRWRQVVGHVGRLDTADGIEELIDCIRRVARTHPSCGWLIAPEPNASRAGRAQLERLERQGRVEIVDARDDLPLFYRALDLFVHPGRHPRLARRLMEAAASAVGAVAYHVPAADTVIEQGQTGQLVEQRQQGALAEAVRAALDDPGRLGAYGRRARSHAVRKFNRRHIEEQMLRMYDSLLEIRLEGSGDR